MRRLGTLGVAVVFGASMLSIGSPAAVATTTVVSCPTDSLQAAINGAAAGDTLTVTGTCVEDIFFFGGGVTIEGLDATLMGSGSSSVVLATGSGLTISGVTITGGGDTIGGGIANHGSLTLDSVTVSANTASVFGGGIYNGGTLVVIDSDVVDNEAGDGAEGVAGVGDGGDGGDGLPGGDGGGIYNAGTLTIIGSTITGNMAGDGGNGGPGATGLGGFGGNGGNGGRGGLGGGIYSITILSVADSTLSGNATGTGGSGGAGGFSVNTGGDGGAGGAGGSGGGIWSGNGLTMESSTISGNVTAAGGDGGAGGAGGSSGSDGASGATGDGGGVSHCCGSFDISNATISGNSGGGASLSDAGGSIVHSTITANTSDTGAGGIAVSAALCCPVQIELEATILFDNSTPDCSRSGGAALFSNGHNAFGPGVPATCPVAVASDLVGADPLLGPLQDNGSPFTHALLQGSPAINAIPTPSCAIATDERGVDRPQGSGCDIGAYEAEPATAVDDGYSTAHNAARSVAAPGVLGNDLDTEGDALTVDNPAGITAANGTVAMAADGSFTYTPPVGFSGNDIFTYRAADATGTSNLATVTIMVASPPPPNTVGLVDPTQGMWHLRNSAGAVTTFFFGNPSDFPLMGDWDCNGTDTPGMYRQSDGFVYVRNSNSVGIADRQFFLGNPGDVPLAGDFNNDGCDTVSIYRPDEQKFYIANKLAANNAGIIADFSFGFGNPGDKPVTGDWDNDGTTEIGLHRETTGFFYWRNTLDTGIASDEIFFGDPGDRFVAGDWGIVDGVDTPAVFRPTGTTFFFRHTLTQGVADSQFVFGESSWLPVAGAFGLG